jgi:acetate kinase
MTSAASRSTVLALNCGSSSLKFGLYRVEASIPKALLSGEVESIGDPQGKFWAKDANDKPLVSARWRGLLAACAKWSTH